MLLLLLFFSLVLSLSSCASVPDRDRGAVTPAAETSVTGGVIGDAGGGGEASRRGEDLPVLGFNEIWSYLPEGREGTLNRGYPITDLVYFGAEIDSYGALTGVPDYRKAGRFPGRLHLALVCNSRGLTHFVLESGSAVRRRLVADLLEASRDFDGLQIDLELIPARDGAAFLSFLAELREGLGDKLFSVALPARSRTTAEDVFDYGKIAPLADRVFVMAYDEHWSSGEPGPIASLDWCRSVAEHALKTIGPDKLIMGMPFYGRAWGSFNPFRAFFYSGIERLMGENAVDGAKRDRGVPYFSYDTSVTVTVFYEDVYSLHLKGSMYRDLGIAAVGFWSLGQEDPGVWNIFAVD